MFAVGRDAGTPESAGTPAHAPMVGVFTGEYAWDLPVYRLPPVNVVGHRGVESTRRASSARHVILL